MSAPQHHDGPEPHAHIYRLAWRERQDSTPPLSQLDHRDTEEEAEALAGEIVATGRVIGEVFVYRIEIQGAA